MLLMRTRWRLISLTLSDKLHRAFSMSVSLFEGPYRRSMIRNMEQVWRELNGFGVLGAKLIPELRLNRLRRTANDKWSDQSEIIRDCGGQWREQSIWEAYRINVLIVMFSSIYVTFLILGLLKRNWVSNVGILQKVRLKPSTNAALNAISAVGPSSWQSNVL